LWQRMVRDVEANAPWQRLRRNLLLILQLIATALLVLALTRPFTWTEGIGGQTAVLVVDTSASMAAADGSPTRLDDAKTQLRMLIDGLPATATATLITAGEDVRIAVSSSRDRRQLHDAVNALRVGAGGSRLDAALELASAVAARQPDAEIVVYSDFAGIDDAGFLLDRIDDAAVRFVTLGARTWNQSVTALALQRAPDAASLIAFVQVTNFREDPVQRRLVLSPAQGDALAAYDLDLPAQGERVVVVEDLPPTLPAVVASLSGEDLLPVDDRAWAVAPTAAAVDVTLVTPGNRFLETALALQPGLSLTTVRPADYRPVEADLTIIDGSLPVTMPLPAGNLLIVGPVRSSELFSVTGELDQPDPLAVDRSDPLLANVNLGEISILRSASIVTPAWARPLVVDAADSTSPLLFAGELGDRRVAVLTFDLRRSDLPLQVAFPILLSNLTGWLAASSAQTPTALDPGQPLAFAPPLTVDAVNIVRPDGVSVRVLPEQGRVQFADTDALGLYQITWGGVTQAQFAVNLAAAQESNIAPQSLTASTAEAGQALPLLQAARREWWRPLAFVALTVLVAEWIAYQRGAV
ncbi:MAG: VWA domain-containing protein, partial [Caldilineaceae bacterium]|nr:VWA domain-containing protein [Caldilineaceae bacterium]